MGPTGPRRRAPVREALPGGLPVRALLADHPAQARVVPPRLRRVRPGHRRRLRRRGGGPAARRPRHRAPPARPAPASLAELPASTPESAALAAELKRRGFRFVGPTTVYAMMQACGVVDDHLAGQGG